MFSLLLPLQVNGVDMTGRSQEELVAMLRSTRQGESVCVVVARQEDIFLPRELVGRKNKQQPRPRRRLRLPDPSIRSHVSPRSLVCQSLIILPVSSALCLLSKVATPHPPFSISALSAHKHGDTNAPRARSGLPAPLRFVDTATLQEAAHTRVAGNVPACAPPPYMLTRRWC